MYIYCGDEDLSYVAILPPFLYRSQGDTDSLEQGRNDNHLVHVYGNRIRSVNYASHIHRSVDVGTPHFFQR